MAKRKKHHGITERRYEELVSKSSPSFDPSLVGTFWCQCCAEWFPEKQTNIHHVHPAAFGGVNFRWNLLRICDSCHGILTTGTTWKTWVLTRLCEYSMMWDYGLLFCLQPGNEWGELCRNIWKSPEFEEYIRSEFPNVEPNIWERGRLLNKVIKRIACHKAWKLFEIKDDREGVDQYRQELDETYEKYYTEHPEKRPLSEVEKRDQQKKEEQEARRLERLKPIMVIDTGTIRAGQSPYDNDWEITWKLSDEPIWAEVKGTIILDKSRRRKSTGAQKE